MCIASLSTQHKCRLLKVEMVSELPQKKNGTVSRSRFSTNIITLLKVEGALTASDIWDVFSGERKAPIVPAAIRNKDDTATVNQGNITTKIAELRSYKKDSKQAASYLLNMISDNQLFHVKPIRTNPVAMWKRLKETFERSTQRIVEAAQMQMPNFQHIEI